MEKRRKRRSAEDVEKSIWEAATTLIEKGGFSHLTTTGIMQKAEIEPVQFYRRYKDLDAFIDEYVKTFDYWFSDVVKVPVSGENNQTYYEDILCNLFDSLWGNKIMQELLRWEIATDNETSRRTAQLREFHTLPLCKKFADLFSDSDTDIVAVSALLVGGIYYMILHNRVSAFSGMDLGREQDRERLQKAIKHLSSLLFQDCVQPSAIKIAEAMKRIRFRWKKYPNIQASLYIYLKNFEKSGRGSMLHRSIEAVRTSECRETV